MKKVKDEDLDKLFKAGLADPGHEPVYREADWEAMEQVLDKGKKRPAIILWLPWLSAAAVVVLAVLAWLLFRPQTEPGNGKKNQQQMSAVKNPNGNTGKSGGTTRPNTADSSSKQNVLTPANYATNPVHHGEAKNTNRSYPYQPVASAAKLPGKGTSQDQKNIGAADATQNPNNVNALAANAPGRKDVGQADANKDAGNAANTNALAANAPGRKDVGQADANAGKDAGNPANANTLAANAPGRKDVGQADANKDTSNPANTNALATNAPGRKDLGQADANKDVNNPANANTVANNRTKIKATVKGSGSGNRAIYAISAIGSSDMNGVNGMQGSRVGGNIGGMFSVSASKWTISTGVMYSIKPYAENYADYHTGYVFKNPPSSIGVNCKMLDIPLNVNYQVYKKQSNRITLGTGLSSYIILREDYKFSYDDPYAYGPKGYSVINKNRNILSVMNLDATFDHQINSKFGITFEPYVKLPFSNVGASQAKLQSAGIAVSLNYNLNPFKKPK